MKESIRQLTVVSSILKKRSNPKGNVKPDWEIHSLMATAMGYPMKYKNTKEIWDEMRELCPLYYGATYEKMAGLGYVPWPCLTLDDPGDQWMYKGNRFATPNGKAQLIASDWRPPLDQVDDDFPLILSTVREVGHYSVPFHDRQLFGIADAG